MRPVELATFGARLRALRRARGLTQAQLARAIGRHQSVIGPYERNEFMPARPVLERLAQALGTSPEYLLFGRDPERSRLRVVGTVGPAGLFATSRDPLALFELREDALLLVVIEDDCMAPVYPPGTLAVVEATAVPAAQASFGREMLAELTDGRILLRRVFPGAHPGRFDLVAWNAPTLTDVGLRSVRAVLGCIRREAFAA